MNSQVGGNRTIKGSYVRSLKSLRDGLIVSQDGLQSVSIVLGGNANTDFLIPGLVSQLSEDGIVAHCSSTDFSSWEMETFTGFPDSDFWVVWLSSAGATTGGTTDFVLELDRVSEAIKRLKARGKDVVALLPEVSSAEFESTSIHCPERIRFLAACYERLSAEAILVPIDPIVASIGLDQWWSPKYWEVAKSPASPDAVDLVAREVGVIISRSLRPRIRGVIVDLDDTLWGGIVGEVGSEGLMLDPQSNGRPYLELQYFLKTLSRRGVMLAVASKNDPESAVRPFRERPEMILREDDFISIHASWHSKSESIKEILSQMNVGVESVCFLDDSAMERDEAKTRLPGLIVPELADNPSERVSQLRSSRLFVQPKIMTEDLLRSTYVRDNKIETHVGVDDYLKSLELRLVSKKIDLSNVDRCASLLQKTNQFNLTLWRPTKRELLDFLASSQTLGFCYRLVDRIGDAGITGVLLGRIDGDRLRIEAWVVSCRVFNRKFETAIITHVAQWASSHNLVTIEATYVVGPRNHRTKTVMTEIGFVQDQAGDIMRLTVISGMSNNHPIRIEGE